MPNVSSDNNKRESIMPTSGNETAVVHETGAGRLQLEAEAGGSVFIVDEPVSAGGLGSGPNPYDLLATALAACTAMTVRLYAERKKFPVAHVRVAVSHHREGLGAKDMFDVKVNLAGPLDDDQKSRIMAIAGRCPVHLTLAKGSDISLSAGAASFDDGAATGQTLSNHAEDIRLASMD